MGRLTDALVHLDALETGGAAPAALRTSAQTLRDDIEPRVGRLVVRVRGEASDACTVEVEDHTLEASSLGEPIAVDPGPARVRLVCGRTIVDQVDVAIPEGGSSHVVLAAMPETVTVDPGALAGDPSAPAVPAAGSGDVTSEAWFWVVIGVAVAAVGAGTAAGVVIGTSPQPTQGNFGMPILEFGP